MSKDNMKSKLQDYYQGNPKEDTKAAVSQATAEAHPSGGTLDPKDVANTAAHDRQTGDSSGVNATGGAAAAKDTLKRTAEENVDEETKEKARAKRDEYRERARNYFSRKMPQERREQTIWRLKVC